MTTYKKDIRKITVLLSVLLLLSAAGWVWHYTGLLQKEADDNKLRQDSILASKLLLDKEISDLNLSLLEYKGKNSALDSSIQKTNTLLNEKIKIIDGLRAENATVKRLKKELNDLKQLRERFQKQMEELLAENTALKKEVSALKDQLANQPKPEVIELPLIVNNFRVELKKKNSKLTVRSKKVKTIQVAFEVKSQLKETKTEEFYVVVKDADGKIISPSTAPAQIKGETISYSALQKIDIGNSFQKVNLSIHSSEKLKSRGNVKILVYSAKDGLIGSTEVAAF